MRALYKYEVMNNGKTEMPTGAEVLSVGAQGEKICVWALVDPSAPIGVRRLIPLATGSHLADDHVATKESFVGTVQMRVHGAELVFHVFDAGEYP